MTILLNFFFSGLATMAFGIITNIPRRALLACGVTGGIGWVLFHFSNEMGLGLGGANFLGALSVGIISVFLSRRYKMPLIIFNIPSLVPLVPGGPAYQAVRQIMQGNYEAGLQNILIVIITAGAIAIGFMVTNLVEKLAKFLLKNPYQIKRKKP
ncbi:threonine/serine exporter family protein [Enterococcus sp. HY326]|uniref:threonine/serine exporter family protein n=1 Tax=Enterococcus sp. HY326 TaxID=2971265 RepID=UPI00223FBB87|nr:threonine/serine exporter family protein [Enterococcus sp. HY326]